MTSAAVVFLASDRQAAALAIAQRSLDSRRRARAVWIRRPWSPTLLYSSASPARHLYITRSLHNRYAVIVLPAAIDLTAAAKTRRRRPRRPAHHDSDERRPFGFRRRYRADRRTHWRAPPNGLLVGRQSAPLIMAGTADHLLHPPNVSVGARMLAPGSGRRSMAGGASATWKIRRARRVHPNGDGRRSGPALVEPIAALHAASATLPSITVITTIQGASRPGARVTVSSSILRSPRTRPLPRPVGYGSAQ